jgi:hypothetical protein
VEFLYLFEKLRGALARGDLEEETRLVTFGASFTF